MFQGFFDDLPAGRIRFQYTTNIPEFHKNKDKIKKKLEAEILYNQKCLEILEDLDFSLRKEMVEEQIECILTPRGNHFINIEEEQYYNCMVYSYEQNLRNLDILGIKYETQACSVAENQYGEETEGPVRLQLNYNKT